MDLDQLTFAKKISDEQFIVYVAIADVNSLVQKAHSNRPKSSKQYNISLHSCAHFSYAAREVID